MNKELKGIIVPAVTPVNEDETIDIEGTKNLVTYLIDNNVHGLFLLGTTGEFTRLLDDQKKRFIDVCVEQISGRIPFGINVSDLGTKKVINNLKFAEKYNPDFAGVSLPTYFLIESTEEQYAFFKNLAEKTSLPLMLYNIPACTGGYINLATIEKLLDQENIVGIKDSSGDLEYMKKISELSRNENFALYNGHEQVFSETLKMGAKGIISSSANIMPAEVVSLYNACINNEKETITKISSHLRFLDKLKNKLDDNVYGIYFLKYILSLRKVCKYHVTMPFNYTIEKSSNVKQFYDYLFESKPKNTIKMHEYDVKKAEKVEVLKYNN